LPHATVQPTAAQESTASYRWKIKRVWNVTVDGDPVYPISDEEARSNGKWHTPAGVLERWRYWRKMTSDPSTYTHYVLFYPPVNNRYNLAIHIEKAYPDISVWTGTVYPPHPPEIHDYIWHRALSNLATNAEKQRRESSKGERLMGQIEVLYAQMWQAKKVEDERAIKLFSKQLLGDQPSSRGLSG